jgi:hypothetical protein
MANHLDGRLAGGVQITLDALASMWLVRVPQHVETLDLVVGFLNEPLFIPVSVYREAMRIAKKHITRDVHASVAIMVSKQVDLGPSGDPL